MCQSQCKTPLPSSDSSAKSGIMGSLGWKTFGFFDAKIRDEHTGEGLVEGVTAVCRGYLDSARVYKQGGTTASVAGGHTVEKSNIHQCTWVGLSNGLVHCLDEDMEVAVAFPTGHGEHDRIWAMGTYQACYIIDYVIELSVF